MVKANFFQAIAAGVLLYRAFKYIGAQKRSIEGYEVSVKKFGLNRIDLNEIDFNVMLEFTNKSGAAVTVGNFDFDVLVNGLRLGRIKSNEFIKLNSYATSFIPFNLRVFLKDLGANSAKLFDLLQEKPNFNIKLVGQFQVETLPGVYKTIPGNFESTISNLIFG